MTYRTAHRPAAKQAWEVGQIVNVGFIKGLVVKQKVATPGDYRPDFYVLWQPATNRFYSFQPGRASGNGHHAQLRPLRRVAGHHRPVPHPERRVDRLHGIAP